MEAYIPRQDGNPEPVKTCPDGSRRPCWVKLDSQDFYAVLAQLVEQITCNDQVLGSIPRDGSFLWTVCKRRRLTLPVRVVKYVVRSKEVTWDI